MGSAQEFDRVPNWREFQDFRVSVEVGNRDDWHWSAAKRRMAIEVEGRARRKRSFPGRDGSKNETEIFHSMSVESSLRI